MAEFLREKRHHAAFSWLDLMPKDWYFLPLTDAAVPQEHQLTIQKYRTLVTDWGVPATTTLCYMVRVGFTLKQHAPKAGPCYDDFRYLQGWNFQDEPTQDSLVFWIPMLVPGSTSKTKAQQLQLLGELRSVHGLPSHHLTSFGSAALLAGLILAHHRATGEQVPDGGLWTRTDICRADGCRLRLSWDGDALYCVIWIWGDERDGRIGGFALGVEALGS